VLHIKHKGCPSSSHFTDIISIQTKQHGASTSSRDKVAIVTGSSSGLGQAIAVRYAQEGAKAICADLTVTAQSQEEAVIATHDWIAKHGGSAIFVRKVDVGNATQMENWVKPAVQEYGRPYMYGFYSRISASFHTQIN
jgi:NAD(P)-dependent dehydrogenase (short-subunit alcohol dehydrogenase family)